MANTVVSRTLVGSGKDKRILLLITVTGDGTTQETNTVVYDNSTFINDVSKGNLVSITASGTSCQVSLAWDQTTDSDAFVINPSASKHHCFKEFGGIGNPNGSGATGDLLMSTLGLSTAGAKFSLLLEIFQN